MAGTTGGHPRTAALRGSGVEQWASGRRPYLDNLKALGMRVAAHAPNVRPPAGLRWARICATAPRGRTGISAAVEVYA